MSLRDQRNALRKQRIREGLHTLSRIVGPRCPDFEPGCFVCQSYHLLDTLQRLPGYEPTLRRVRSTHEAAPPAPTPTPTKEGS
ncbi:MAG: hypothetical protein RJA99_3207 [Pseudomonadota bacterium]|jgi:hypothetical protein